MKIHIPSTLPYLLDQFAALPSLGPEDAGVGPVQRFETVQVVDGPHDAGALAEKHG
jgi:hypothetical protein